MKNYIQRPVIVQAFQNDCYENEIDKFWPDWALELYKSGDLHFWVSPLYGGHEPKSLFISNKYIGGGIVEDDFYVVKLDDDIFSLSPKQFTQRFKIHP